MNFLSHLLFILITSIYSLSFEDINGNQTNLSQFQGKKILIINFGTNSPQIHQLDSIQVLQNHFGNQIGIVLVPSNSFNSEPLPNSDILNIVNSHVSGQKVVCAKSPVIGSNAISLFQWLGNGASNGFFNAQPIGDFTKYIIDENGEFIQMFSSKVSPSDSLIVNVLSQNNN